MRRPGLLVLASLVIAFAVVLARDPEEPWAVAVLIVSLGLAVGAGAYAWQQRSPRGGGRRRAPLPRRSDVLRRAAESGGIVTALLWLRVVDGLSPLTATFVVASFVVAELVVSARPHASR